MGHDGRIQTRRTENQVPRSANPQVSQSAGGGISPPQPSKLVIMPPTLLTEKTGDRFGNGHLVLDDRGSRKGPHQTAAGL